MKEVVLTQGYVAVVDDEDFGAVMEYNWHVLKRGRSIHAGRWFRNADGTRVYLYMHQFLMPEAVRIDHRDGDGLNNQRYNLRTASFLQNSRGSRKKRVVASSKYRGVHWHPGAKKFRAMICVLGKSLHLGYFPVEIDAARAYNEAAVKYFGDFASPNIV